MIADLYERNVGEGVMPKEEFVRGMVVRHKYKNKPETQRRGTPPTENWVFECTARIRNRLKLKDRVFVGWECCRIKDYLDVVRCFKC